jgi:hypothetical protein
MTDFACRCGSSETKVHLAIIPEVDERFDSRLRFPIYVLAVTARGHGKRRGPAE